jgi:D-Tyr-tRNAtyr deacylase
LDRARGDTISGKNGVAMKNHRVALGFVLLLAALGVTLDGSLALIAIDRIAQSEEYTDEMDKIETYRGFEIRAFEREQGRWRAEIRKADGSMLKILVGDSRHRTSITTSADTLAAETSIDEVKKAIDAGGLS